MRLRLLRIFTASVFGTLFYLIWMVIFLLTIHLGAFIESALWLLAPVVTGTGFFSGILIFDRWNGLKTSSPRNTLLWPLLGCVLGALVVYWYGPMLIVFSMLLMGVVSVAAREYLLWRKK